MGTYTIGQLAAAAGVAASTVRFYEREKLLVPEARTGGNYRTYTAGSLEKLRFIRAAQASGFQLNDVREMLALTDSEQPPCREIFELIDRRLDDVRARMKELKRVQRTLHKARKNCCQGGADWCGALSRLKRPAAAAVVAATARGARAVCPPAGQKRDRP